jgi:hypothetical protein
MHRSGYNQTEWAMTAEHEAIVFAQNALDFYLYDVAVQRLHEEAARSGGARAGAGGPRSSARAVTLHAFAL